jgi:hypothetical protein
MDESPNSDENEETGGGGVAGPNTAVQIKKRLPGGQIGGTAEGALTILPPKFHDSVEANKLGICHHPSRRKNPCSPITRNSSSSTN